MTLFEGRDLTCVRGERRVFAGLDFALPAGGALLLLGANGSGKSSLLRLMAGLLKPAEGRIAWKGEDVRRDPEAHRARLHYLGHLDAVKPVLTVAENLAFWAAEGPAAVGPTAVGPTAEGPTAEGPTAVGSTAVGPAAVGPAAVGPAAVGPTAVAGALERLDLAWLADTPGRLLSAGQKRRLALARLLVRPGRLWLLDEPTVGLDETSLEGFHRILAAHRAGGGLAVAATHTPLDLPGAERLSLDAFSGDAFSGDAFSGDAFSGDAFPIGPAGGLPGW